VKKHARWHDGPICLQLKVTFNMILLTKMANSTSYIVFVFLILVSLGSRCILGQSQSQSILSYFQKYPAFQNFFCGDKFEFVGLARSVPDCAGQCGPSSLCTGFYWDVLSKQCYTTSLVLTDTTGCAIREGVVMMKQGKYDYFVVYKEQNACLQIHTFQSRYERIQYITNLLVSASVIYCK